MNARNNAGINLSGVGGSGGSLNIFNQPSAAPGSALGLTVVMTDANDIAAAGPGGGVGDNSNAVAMAGLAGAPIVAGKSPSNFFSNFVTTLGATVSQVETENTAENASVMQLQNQNNALSAVNLSSEAVAMQQLERSYQAASRVFAILNAIMASALNLGVQTSVG